MSSQKPDGSTSSLSPLGKPIPESIDTPRPPLPLECAQDPVDSFFAFVKEYCTGEDFKRLKELSLENKKLRERVEKLEIAYHENISTLAKSDTNCRSEHDRFEEANRAREDALRELRGKDEAVKKLNARISGLENDIKTLTITSKSWEKQTMDSTAREEARATELKRAEQDMKNLQHKLQTAAKQLESKSTELGRVRDNFRVVRSFVVELDSIGDEKAHIQGLLAGFFSLAQKLMEDFLRNDLDRPCLDDYVGWDNLRTQVSANEYIPLPASNSVAAKGMRVVAGLVLLGRTLVEYVFRPVHITQHNELDIILRDLGSQNPLQEMYARASLLKILPDRQKKNQEASIELVVKQVSHTLNHLIPLSRQDEFKLSLRGVTAQICRSWSRVQKLEEKIKPSFSFDLPEDWQQLPPEIPRAPSSHSIQSPKQEKKAGRQVQQQSPRSSSSTLLPGSVLNTEFKEVIWPAFLVADPENSQQEAEEDGGIDLSWALIFQGYILTNTQAKTAEQERATEQEASRRARKIARQNSSDHRQAIRKRRDSAIDFLKPSRDDLKETDGK